MSNTEIAETRRGSAAQAVLLWRGRYETGGIASLEDLDRPGRPRQVEQSEVVIVSARTTRRGR